MTENSVTNRRKFLTTTGTAVAGLMAGYSAHIAKWGYTVDATGAVPIK